jgi:LSD1 subclass zinc finger protein
MRNVPKRKVKFNMYIGGQDGVRCALCSTAHAILAVVLCRTGCFAETHGNLSGNASGRL